MTRSVMFVDETKKQAIRGWYDRFRSRLVVPTEEREMATSFGRTHLLVAGPEGAPPLIVVHGALASSAHVLPELGPLVETRRCFVIDVIGQSVMSEDRRIDLAGDDYGRWIAEIADGLGLDRFDLLGASWGGFVAMRGARVLGDRVRHLVLVVPAGVVMGSAWEGFRAMGWPMMLYRAFPSEARLERLVQPLFTTPDPEWTTYFGEAVRSYRFDFRPPPLARPEDVAPITAPVLIFAAEHDLSFPGAPLIARARELFPRVETELIEGARHSPPTTAEFRGWLGRRTERFLEA